MRRIAIFRKLYLRHIQFMQKNKKLRIFLVLFLSSSLMAFTGCQSSSDGAATGEGIENPLSGHPDAQHRFDQSAVAAINIQIQQSTSGQLNRSIPNLGDSRISYCESVNGESGKYNGVRDTKRYPLASVSKLFLTAWALDKLGPDYKFENQWYLKKVSDGLYDVYFKANYDPALNIEKMLYAMALMRAQGVQKIRQLVIDETTRVYLSVLNDPHVELSEVPVSSNQSIENLKLIFNSSNWGGQTDSAKNNLLQFAQQKERTINVPNTFSVEQVLFSESKNIKLNQYTSVIKMKSSLLLKYLKYINVNSNNYMTDTLFKILGGQVEFRKFQQSRLGLTTDELQFNTGSGLPIISIGIRTDNTGTCVSVLKTLKFINGLSKQLNFNIGHVLLTAGADHGTYDPVLPLNLNHNMALKTGRLYDVPALNVAGMTSLKTGTLYFAYFTHDFSNEEESIYQNKRDQILNSILEFYPTTPGYLSMDLNTVFAD